jgi:DNA-binding MarR family transcriptional regulator
LHGVIAEHFGLTATDLKALDLLQRRGALPTGEIARATGLATASVTSLVDRLERKRFVRRTRDRGDRRKVVVTLAAAMHTRIAPLFAPLERRVRVRAARYTSAELTLVATFMNGVAADMRDVATALTSPSRGTL